MPFDLQETTKQLQVRQDKLNDEFAAKQEKTPLDYKKFVELANSMRESVQNANTPIQLIRDYVERHDMKPNDPLMLTFEKTQVSVKQNETSRVHVERTINTTPEKATNPKFELRIAAMERDGFTMRAPYHPGYLRQQNFSMVLEKSVEAELAIRSYIVKNGLKPEDSLTLRFSKGEDTEERITTAGRALCSDFTRNLDYMAKDGFSLATVERTAHNPGSRAEKIQRATARESNERRVEQGLVLAK